MGLRAARRMDVEAGEDAGDDPGTTLTFDFPTWLVSAECWDNALTVSLSYDGITDQDAFEVDPTRPFLFPFEARSAKVQNKDEGMASRYQVAGLD